MFSFALYTHSIIIQKSRSIFYQFKCNSDALIQITVCPLNNLCNQMAIVVSKYFITFK